jgi:hypothetical protein
MTRPLSTALIGDGPSDQVLSLVIEWAIRRLRPDALLRDVGFIPRRSRDLIEAIHSAASLLRPDLLFVHRDAERAALSDRRAQIPSVAGVVKVVPVRMTEAWLLISADAIRRAAGNPNGRVKLDLPPVKRLERLPDPKALLHELLIRASGLDSPRRKKLLRRDLGILVRRVAALISDFSLLDDLTAYRDFEDDLRVALDLVWMTSSVAKEPDRR